MTYFPVIDDHGALKYIYIYMKTLRTNLRFCFLIDLVSVCITYFRQLIDTGGRLMVLGVVREIGFSECP